MFRKARQSIEKSAAGGKPNDAKLGPWYRQLDRQQWIVVLAAAMGWLFDAMDQRIFILARSPAIADLMGPTAGDRTEMATYVTAVFIAGWATGGLIFGIYGDRWGRVRTMLVTILIYSLFTGLSAFAVSVWDFGAYRFLCGLGIGGEFAAGVALVAEVLPDRTRPGALAFLQMMAMLGTLMGTCLSMIFVSGVPALGVAGWRLLFFIGLLPALLLQVFRRRLRESPAWLAAAKSSGMALGDLRELLTGKPWLRHSLIGMILGLAGQLGIWGAGTWTPELIRGALAEERATAVGPETPASAEQIARQEDERALGVGLILKDIGSCLGIYLFSVVATRRGRRPAFALAMLGAMVATIYVFHSLHRRSDIWWMMPILGFFCWSLLGGYAIYFPELYPTRLRSTGIGFCYNVARYLTAAGVLGLGQLTLMFAGLHGTGMPLRLAAMTVGLIYLLGLAVLPWAPETRGRELPQ